MYSKLGGKRNPYNFGEKGWRALKSQAANWRKINIPEGSDYYYCTNVYEKIKNFGNAFVKHIELLRNYSIFGTRKSKTNMAKNKY